ncbi:alkaline phosphatase family protein [soil metagenome]
MRPNLLLITADQWRGDCLGAAGHAVVKTPNLDRLAGEGTCFTAHYAQASPCGPSRASLYTGLYQMNHRVVRNGTPLDARHDTIALALRRLGYDPTLFGYTDQAVDPRTVPADSPWLRTYEGILPGFTVGVNLPEEPTPWLEWLASRGIAVPANYRDIHRPIGEPSDRPTNASPIYGIDETQTAFLADRFLDWLGQPRAGEPWCAHLSFMSPHPPFVAPPPFNTMFRAEEGPSFRRAATSEDEFRQHPLLAYWRELTVAENYLVGGGPGRVADWSEEDFRTVRAVYWGMIAEVDRQIGRVIDATSSADTVIVCTSDHGDQMGDHWTLGKFGYFDQSYHVPLIVRDPRRPAGRGAKVDAFTESVDIMPTLVELAGGQPSARLDGRSLAPFLEGTEPPDWRDAVHWEYDFREVETGSAQEWFGLDLDSCSLAVHRDRRHKYVHFTGLPPLLFDLADDPGELCDRAGDPAYAAVRLESAEKLLSWRARRLDRMLTGTLLTPAGPVVARS